MMIEITAVTAPKEMEAKEMEAKDMNLDMQSDQHSDETIETIVITATKELDARNIALDVEVLTALHPTARIVRAFDHGTNHSSRTIRFDTRSPMPEPLRQYPEYWNGIYKSFFLKTASGKLGHDMMRGEYNSAKAIHDILPYTSFIPKPLKWGTLARDKNTHFLLSHYHELDSQILNTSRFVSTLAQLHLHSASHSKNFGFHVTTHNGTLPQINRRTATWEEYFSTNIVHLLDLENEIQGPHTPELHALSTTLLAKVIPRLLRPLETYPNSITPTLLHGNLTPANVSTSLHTKAPITYDPCAFYGHNEYDLRAFVGGRFGVEALEMYQRLVPVSEPGGDFGDRMRLYGLSGLLGESCRYPGEGRWREMFVEGMRVLVERYGGGLQEGGVSDGVGWGGGF